MYTLVAIIGLAVLMIVHEAGHFLMARRAGMRVTKFSIGFGPTFFKIQPIDESQSGERVAEGAPPPQSYFWFTAFGDRIRFRLMKYDPAKHGPTIYQVAMIPFLAYVQVAGMNPLEDVEPNDKGSYANARLWPRIKTIAGGPLANYLFASVFFFVALYFDGDLVQGTQFNLARDEQSQEIVAGRPAEKAGLKDGDRIVEIDGQPTKRWEDIPKLVGNKADQNVHIVVMRDGEREEFDVVPYNDNGTSRIGIMAAPGDTMKVKLSVSEAGARALEQPVLVVRNVVIGINEWIHKREKGELHSTIQVVKEIRKAAQTGWADYLMILGALSAYLAVFNLLPLPALDGGRLVFLGFEAVTRKRPNPTMEAQIHAVGLVMLLGLMVYITFANDLGLGSK
jgi:regulator of sigma E protease